MRMLIPVLLFSGILNAKDFSASIGGKIEDEKNQPVIFANVLLLAKADSSLVKTALSDTSGIYLFEKIPAGEYIVSATYVGYEKNYSETISINENTADVRLPVLVLKSSATLSEVVISKTRNFIEMRNGKMIVNPESSPVSAGNSAMDVLRQSPGISVDKDENISLRGKQNVLVMIDDKLTYLSKEQLAAFLNNTPASSIENIEIITNPSAKYDASGNAGVINLQMKKLKRFGYNGSIMGGAGYGLYEKYYGNLNLNSRTQHYNIFGSLNYRHNTRGNDHYLNRTVAYQGNNTVFDQIFSNISESDYTGYKAGIDYFPQDRTTVGIMINGSVRPGNSFLNNNTYISGYNNNSFSSLLAETRSDEIFKNFMGNINLVHQLDTSGKKISADLDYSTFYFDETGNFITRYYNPAGSETDDPYRFRNELYSGVDIWAFKSDYEQRIRKEGKLEAGAKSSFVTINNRTFFEILENGIYTPDTTRNNDFSFSENIYAAYLNYNGTWKKITFSGGLRTEYTDNSGISSSTSERTGGEYISFFPSFSLSHPAGKKHNLSYSYSRRIDRPTYQDLNPFIHYADQYTYELGNPHLKPQYTEGFSITHGFMETAFTSLGADITRDYIGMILDQNDSTKVTYITNTNYKTAGNYYLNVSSGIPVAKWYMIQFNLSGFYSSYHSIVRNTTVKNEQLSARAFLSNSFKLKKDFSIELSSNYQSPAVYGLFRMKSQFYADIGIKKSFSKKHIDLRASLTDIFNTRQDRIKMESAGLNVTYRNVPESRKVNVSLTYTFGRSDIKASRRRVTATEEERNRVKQ